MLALQSNMCWHGRLVVSLLWNYVTHAIQAIGIVSEKDIVVVVG